MGEFIFSIMKAWTGIIALLSTFALGSAYDVFHAGSYEVSHYNIQRPLETFNNNLGIWAPNDTSIAGPLPILYFIGGFNGVMLPLGYDYILRHVASHGYIIVAVAMRDDPIEGFNADFFVDDHIWCEANLRNDLIANGFPSNIDIDFDSEFLWSHSSGAHTLVNYLYKGCSNVKGLILGSPVDGVDPFGFVDNFAITPGEKLNFTVPTLILPAGLDNEPGIHIGPNGTELFPPCAPDEFSTPRFVEAMNPETPYWMVNATEYGHADLLDPEFVATLHLTHLCAYHDGGIFDYGYKRFVGGEMVAFMKGTVDGDCALFQHLEDAETIPIRGLQVEITLGGPWDIANPCFTGPYCIA